MELARMAKKPQSMLYIYDLNNGGWFSNRAEAEAIAMGSS